MLGTFTTVATKLANHIRRHGYTTYGTPSQSLLSPDASTNSSSSRSGNDAQMQEANALQRDIDALFTRLNDAIDGMHACVVARSGNANAYTLERFRTIYNEYDRDYRKAKELIGAATRRAQLLDMQRNESASSSSSSSSTSGLRPRTELLLREQSSLGNSSRMADDAIAQVQAARANLQAQARTVMGAAGKLGTAAKKMPVINSLITSIGRKKKKDMIVIAVTLAVCMALMVMYTVRKS